MENAVFVLYINFSQENAACLDSVHKNGQMQQKMMKKDSPEYDDEAIFEVCESKLDVSENVYQNC